MIIHSQFKSAWWLPGAHLQTIAPLILPHKKIETIPEELELPDGDFLELAWTEKPQLGAEKPIVIVLHGIEGSVNSHYAKTILHTLKKRELVGLFMHFRGCGVKPNRKPESYHSGRTDDLACLIHFITEHYPSAPLAAVGFSLGGNVLTKFMGELEESSLKAGVVVCAPLNLAVSADAINHGASKLYRNYLLAALKSHVQLKIENKMLSNITRAHLKKIKTLREFDYYYTVPVHGFKSVDDYYQNCSGWFFLKNIKTPTLILHSHDDPFINSRALPTENELSDQVTFEVSEKGGHIGFISGDNPLKPTYWFADRAIDFLSAHILKSVS